MGFLIEIHCSPPAPVNRERPSGTIRGGSRNMHGDSP